MENALLERSQILESILTDIFRASDTPPDVLLKRVSIHQAIAQAPQKIVCPNKVKPNIQGIVEKYAPPVDLVVNHECQVCPLTQGKISKAWVGDCGHVFEEATILDYMEKKKSKFCPIYGCDRKLRK